MEAMTPISDMSFLGVVERPWKMETARILSLSNFFDLGTLNLLEG